MSPKSLSSQYFWIGELDQGQLYSVRMIICLAYIPDMTNNFKKVIFLKKNVFRAWLLCRQMWKVNLTTENSWCSRTREIISFIPHSSQNLMPTLSTTQVRLDILVCYARCRYSLKPFASRKDGATEVFLRLWLSNNITWGNSLDFLQLPLEPQKALYHFNINKLIKPIEPMGYIRYIYCR